MMCRMNEDTVKQYSLAEIAFLTIFMLGLMLSWLLVKSRHRVLLSDPVTLPGAGLSVCMPVNTGWNFESGWRYESDSSMVLVGQHQFRQARKTSIRWRYVICSPALTAADILQHRAAETGSRLGPVKTLSGPLAMQYAIVYPEGSEYTFYLGVAPLDFGRHLELQVFVYQQFDLHYADTLFQSLAAGIDYNPPEPLKAGMELVDRFWQAVQSGSLAPGSRDDAVFLLKNTTNQPVGYSYSHTSPVRTNSDIRWQMQTRHYEHRLSRIKSTLLIDASNQHFNWKTTLQQAGAGRPRQYTLMQEAGSGVDIRTDFEGGRQLSCNRLLLPELLLPDCAALLLENGAAELTVDILSATGLVVPTILKQEDVQTAAAQSEQIAFVVSVDFLNNPYLYEELYYDTNRQLIGRFERRPSAARLWEPATPEELERIFGDNFQPLNENVAILHESEKSF